MAIINAGGGNEESEKGPKAKPVPLFFQGVGVIYLFIGCPPCSPKQVEVLAVRESADCIVITVITKSF